jgi:hypothetical protein
VRAAVDEQDRRHAQEAARVGQPAPAPLWYDDDHNVVRRIALGHLCKLAADQVPDAPPARILATIADAYPGLADECARWMAMQARDGPRDS